MNGSRYNIWLVVARCHAKSWSLVTTNEKFGLLAQLSAPEISCSMGHSR